MLAGMKSTLTIREVMGWTSQAPAQTWLALRGDPTIPGSRFGTSSLRVFTPRLGVATWLGRRMLGRQIPVVNLYNRTPTPVTDGWSVRVTQVRDFRGGALTYDSHNGTDFAVPPGTPVLACAAGRVATMRSEYNRGGLKVYVDHGGGLLTTYHHLARALVRVGDTVAAGQPLALSGYSGLDALITFPFVAPHLHFNVLLGGVVVDPFAAEGEVSLWGTGDNLPRPDVGGAPQAPTRFDAGAVDALRADLRDPRDRDRFAAIADLHQRAWELVIESFTYPTRFTTPEAGRMLFDTEDRAPRLALPFGSEVCDGIAYADEVGLR